MRMKLKPVSLTRRTHRRNRKSGAGWELASTKYRTQLAGGLPDSLGENVPECLTYQSGRLLLRPLEQRVNLRSGSRWRGASPSRLLGTLLFLSHRPVQCRCVSHGTRLSGALDHPGTPLFGLLHCPSLLSIHPNTSTF